MDFEISQKLNENIIIPRIKYDVCPLCESTNIPKFLEAKCLPQHEIAKISPIIIWHQCQDCQHVFTQGYFNDQAFEILLGRTQTHQQVGFEFPKQRPVSARIVEHVIRHVKDGRWLDVGFGNASLIFTAEEYGYQPIGIDLRPNSVKIIKELGYEAYHCSIEQLPSSESFSVISMADVLEHMPFPKIGLGSAHKLLQPKGILFLSMPNMESFVWRAMHFQFLNQDDRSSYWGEIEHYHNFSRTRLYALLEEQGFQPLEYHISERYLASMEVIAIKKELENGY